LTGLIQDLEAGGHGDVNLGVGDLNQVRSRTRASTTSGTGRLTLNASLGFGDLILSASYFDRTFSTRRMPRLQFNSSSITQRT
jgi:hypothetical protein